MVMTAMSVATPMVRPSTVRAARNLCARMASTERSRLSRGASMSHTALSRGATANSSTAITRRRELSKQHLTPLMPHLNRKLALLPFYGKSYLGTVDPNGAGLDLPRRVAYRIGQSDFWKQLVYPELARSVP